VGIAAGESFKDEAAISKTKGITRRFGEKTCCDVLKYSQVHESFAI
jgi:hypothetical protein